MIKQLFLVLLIGMIFLYGCADKDIELTEPLGKVTGKVIGGADEPASDAAEETTRKEESQENKAKEDKVKTKEKDTEEEYYGAEELINDTKRWLKLQYYNFSRDKSHPDYIRSNDLKYYVIHTIRNKEDRIENFEQFCDKYCAENWDGIFYYVNKSTFDTYYPLLGKENFSTEAKYNDYHKNRILVNHTRKERIYEVENGKVLEYKFWLLEQDESGNFVSNPMSYILLYKIYCSPNMTVFIRPKWQDFSVTATGKITQLIKNWEVEDDRVREELLEKINRILEFCPVEKEFFDDYEIKPYFKSELLAAYWKVYQEKDLNVSSNQSIGVKTRKNDNQTYLEEINVSLTNHDDISLYNIGLEINVIADDKNDYDYYESEHVSTRLDTGKSIFRKISKEEISFEDNITVESIFKDSDYGVVLSNIRETYKREDFINE